ncbi:MAG: ribonuclease H-like domain-containing protein, partial [Aquificaceae bacterium]
MGKVASLDIETFCPIEELEEGDVTYLKGRKDYSSEEDFHRDLSTNPYVSLLLSFSLFLPEEGVAYVFYLGEEESEEISRVNIGEISIEAVYASLSLKKGISESESRLVELFWKQLEQIDTLVTFYGKDFDMEFLKIRTLIHGVKSPAFYRYFHSKSVNHIDLRDVFRVGRNHYSLNFISRRMKLPIDKGDMDGSKITNVFLKGEYRKVADYNLRDALLTGMLYERVKDHLYHN